MVEQRISEITTDNIIMNDKLKKEVCGCCKKFINIGHAIIECQNCSIAIHTNCFENSNFDKVNDLQYCEHCIPQIDRRYNPYSSELISGHGDNCNLHYNEDITETLEVLTSASHTLNTCTPHTTALLLYVCIAPYILCIG